MKNMLTRLLACLLVAAALIPCVAAAELDTTFEVPKFSDIFTPASEYRIENYDVPTVQYTHESGAITFQIPESWTLTEGDTGAVFPIFYAEDGIGNLNITASETDGENMVPAFNELKQVFTEQYAQVGATVNSFELTSFRGRDAIVCELEYLGFQQTQVMVQPDDYSALLIFTFTASANKHLNLVMNSLWLG